MPDGTAVHVEDLRKTYGATKAVDGVTFDVRRGEVFGLLGPNGAGKTTTVEILEGLRAPDSGTVVVLGLDVARHAEALKERIGVSLQTAALYPKLTVEELLDLFGAFYRRHRSTTELIALLDLDEKRTTRTRDLSGGQRQRLSVALALVNDPEIVFLDEPMSGLDPVGRREVRDLIAGLRTTGTTVFFCSHILSDIEVLCDRAAILRRGRLAHVGRLEELRGAAGERRAMELIFAVADAAQIRSALSALEGATVVAVPGGARVEVSEERDVDAALGAVRKVAGARLVSVQPVGNPLEELFAATDGEPVVSG